jgi:hypothetical protein
MRNMNVSRFGFHISYMLVQSSRLTSSNSRNKWISHGCTREVKWIQSRYWTVIQSILFVRFFLCDACSTDGSRQSRAHVEGTVSIGFVGCLQWRRWEVRCRAGTPNIPKWKHWGKTRQVSSGIIQGSTRQIEADRDSVGRVLQEQLPGNWQHVLHPIWHMGSQWSCPPLRRALGRSLLITSNQRLYRRSKQKVEPVEFEIFRDISRYFGIAGKQHCISALNVILLAFGRGRLSQAEETSFDKHNWTYLHIEPRLLWRRRSARFEFSFKHAGTKWSCMPINHMLGMSGEHVEADKGVISSVYFFKRMKHKTLYNIMSKITCHDFFYK